VKFSGIKTIDELLTKEGATIPSDAIDDDFIEEFTNNLKVFPDTIDAIPTLIAGPDRSVGIDGPYIEEAGASIKATTHISKETALSVGLEQGSIKEYVEEHAAEVVRIYSEQWDTIEKLFVSAIYDERVQNAGIPLSEIKDDVNQGFRCTVLNITNSEDGESVVFKLEFYS